MKTKRILAKEILIFFSYALMLIIAFFSLKVWDSHFRNKYETLIEKRIAMEDLYIKMSMDSTRFSEKEKSTIKEANRQWWTREKIQTEDAFKKMLSPDDKNQIFKWVAGVLFIIIYFLRGIYFSINWSIKTLKDV